MTKKDAAHEDLAFELAYVDLVRSSIQHVLGHDTTERVCSQEPVISSESAFADLFHGGCNMAIDLLRVHFIKDEVRDANPGLVAGCGSLQLERLSNLSVLSGVVIGALDPHNSEGCP